VNALPASCAAADAAATTVDERNPWLGLASFTEETRAYFFGRDDEVAELARRVQRKLLTVLFGQSGLGKTSILRAGLVPRLRGQGYCPVYVRIAYGSDSPEPAEQIKQAISRTARRSGEWTQAGVAVEGESLWEYLHHRDDVLRDESGATLIPLLIFDQFEEIFTLAQSDEFGRARAARFIDELADLVENRPPKSLEAKLDEDESGAERFDFARGDYRVLIALREDYLAPLEGLKKAMPSISQNRLRLAPMTGEQALAAVLQPGKRLVTEEVAAAIVRFVAGGAELAHAEVEPSLLSLICRELNDARIAQGREEISLDLLAGSHATILSNFYERALADQPPAARQIVEDDLLTSSGFRENVAEERLLSRFKAVGAHAGTLAVLVNRRLLRIEERLDVRRVELTHDVLCGVVKSSRDLRREREAREATERLLAEQHSRELAARHALVRARQIAIGCTMLAIGAVAAALFAYFSSQRARRAELEAQQTRAVSDEARMQAEQLLGYLTDDFVRELQSFGRLDVVAEFTKRQIDYFHALPPALKDTVTIRNGALAMVQYARALRSLGKLDVSDAVDSEAIQLLDQLRRDGDTSEATTIALALGYAVKAQILDNRNDPAGPQMGKHAAELLRPIAEAPNASAASRRAYADVLVRVAFEQQNSNQNEAAVASARKSMKFAAELGARDLSNIEMSAVYAESGAWLVSALAQLGRNEEARRDGLDALAIADKVVEQRPGYRLALHAAQIIQSDLAQVATNELDPQEAQRLQQRGAEISVTLLKLDPANTVNINNAGVADQGIGDALWAMGKLREAIPYYLKSLGHFGSAAKTGEAGYTIVHGYDVTTTSYHQAQLGDANGAAATIASGEPFLAALRSTEPAGSMAVSMVDVLQKLSKTGAAYQLDDLAGTQHLARAAAAETESTKPSGNLQESQKYISLFVAYHLEARANYLLGDFAGAERAERASIDARKHSTTEAVADRRDFGELSTWLAMAIARQGRAAEAAAIIAPVVKFQRQLAARNRGDQWQGLELAAALCAQALTNQQQGPALLREAAAKIDALPASMRGLRDVRLWRSLISEAQRGPG
jgi:AAA+ ATPase superfamily predicted ATPase